jgi:beta-lactam-binding protein with PASTA domain
VLDDAAADVVELSARESRRQSTVVVPNVIGLSWNDAGRVLVENGLTAVGPAPGGPRLAAPDWTDGTITDQSPESGAKVPAGSPVTLWSEPGGGSAGVREPRRPNPSPKSAQETRYESTDEAIG